MKQTWTEKKAANGKVYYVKNWPVDDGSRVMKSYGSEGNDKLELFLEHRKLVADNGGKWPSVNKNPLIPRLIYYFECMNTEYQDYSESELGFWQGLFKHLRKLEHTKAEDIDVEDFLKQVGKCKNQQGKDTQKQLEYATRWRPFSIERWERYAGNAPTDKAKSQCLAKLEQIKQFHSVKWWCDHCREGGQILYPKKPNGKTDWSSSNSKGRELETNWPEEWFDLCDDGKYRMKKEHRHKLTKRFTKDRKGQLQLVPELAGI